MITPIVLYGDPILRKSCSPYEIGTDLSEITQDLWDTMYNARGVGLAAPQIGKEKRIFVVDIEILKQVFVNPKIIEYKGNDMIMDEGCLSIPGANTSVIRKDKIVIEYFDEEWNFFKKEFDGLKSRVIQHEYDHLNGVLHVDNRAGISMPVITALKNCKTKNVNVLYPIQ